MPDLNSTSIKSVEHDAQAKVLTVKFHRGGVWHYDGVDGNTYRELLAKTPVDHLEVREHPAVFFRVSDNTWLEAIVRYLVEPKQAGRIKTRLLQELLGRLNAEPERVLFPKSNMR